MLYLANLKRAMLATCEDSRYMEEWNMIACTSYLKGKLIILASLSYTQTYTLYYSRGLIDNCESEKFSLCHDVGGKSFPCQYVKVVPLQTWGGMLYSIWYIELHGITDMTIVVQAEEWLHQVHNMTIIFMCFTMKYGYYGYSILEDRH